MELNAKMTAASRILPSVVDWRLMAVAPIVLKGRDDQGDSMSRLSDTLSGIPGVATRVLDSRAWRAARSRAVEYVRNPVKLKALIDRATQKTKSPPSTALEELWAYLMAMIRLMRAYWNGTYRDVSPADFAMTVAAVVYFVMPLDVFPDWIPVAGYVDDAFVVAFALGHIKNALNRFIEWENEQVEGNGPRDGIGGVEPAAARPERQPPSTS